MLFSYFIMNILSNNLIFVFVLVRVVYLTMLERKILRYVQNCKGPNKVEYIGLMHFRDGFSLLSKEYGTLNFKSNYYICYICPMILIMFMMLWSLVPCITNVYCLNYSILIIFILIRLSGFMILIIGWRSNSMFSLIDSIRFISQSISYEVRFILIHYCLIILRERYCLGILVVWQLYAWNIIVLLPIFICFVIRILADINHSLMDFVGESELVSGFNVKYFGVKFALIFIADYGIIIFFVIWFYWCLVIYYIRSDL